MARRPTNRLKEELNVEEPVVPVKEEKAEKKQAVKPPKSSSRFILRISESLDKWKVFPLLGLFLILSSACMLIAFTSYIFTWQVDYDKVSGSVLNVLSPSVRTENWLGNFGALVSNLFVGHWFGIASFGFVLLFFLWGIRLLTGLSLLPLLKTFRISIFLILWTSVTMGFLFHTSHLFLGGGIGYFTSGWLENFAGKAGTIALIAFTGLTFLIINNLVKIPDFKTKTPTNEETETESDRHDIEEEVEKTPETPKNEIKEVVKQPEVIEFAVEETKPPVVAEKKVESKAAAAVEFSIEKVPEIKEVEETKPSEKKIPTSSYDPTLDLSSYKYPPLELLQEHGKDEITIDPEELTANKDRIVATLLNYNIAIKKIKATPGPTVTLYEIIPQDGTRISKIKNLEDDIALSLSALGIRIIAPIPGQGTVGIEVPNRNPSMVSMRSIIASDQFKKSDMELPIGLGKTISDQPFVMDLTKMPHLLMAGATGQGKSVGLNAVLVSLLYKKHPAQVKFVLIDPKKVELTLFNKIERHFLAKLPNAAEAIITDTKSVIHTLNSLCIEMDQRYDLLKDAQVRNIKEYNDKFIARRLNPEKGHKFLPYIVLIIDEFADLIMTAGKEVETPIARLAQLARAIGIHLIIATQRPSVNIITGTIKANFPARLAFRVISKIDSRTILDSGGADQLIGRGDMLLATGSDIIRLQCAFVTTKEVEDLTEFIGGQQGYPDAFHLPEYVEEGSESEDGGGLNPDERDSLFEQSARLVVESQQGSASLLQRKLKIGYNRAGRIVDQLQAAGIIGPFEGSKARDVLIKDFNSLEEKLKAGSGPLV
ncbi:MAG TPA: DNA translocase FtsK 4TM domain-containing protein [Bacteroidia bacterium]|nr:DNA translocase FtsK 4TM domain-containing protein [Bacteroidia bacterium]